MKMKPSTIMRLISWWPPYLFAGIRVKEYNEAESYVITQAKLSWWNSNAFRTHFGGTLFAMCDPFYVFLLAHHLGRDYYIWDLASTIEFKKATKAPVTAKFQISPEQVEAIRQDAESGEKVTPVFQVEVLDREGTVIASVEKTLYVKRKKR